ncbi:hypothetical protein DVH05_008646 [Phytophthora capsici]|nr:hypothetical protein DVH05_008646 [Phytophthora capsici]
MEGTRQAIRQGRLLADAGLDEHAMETWKGALSGAYSSQDYAGMFVLSGNIGEVCIRIATRSNASPKASTLLQEAKEHLDYALQIVEQCNLREMLGGYKIMYQGVRRVEGLKRKAEKLVDKLGKEEVVACTTCRRVGMEIVLDENDGCYYCTECYDEYYAADVKTEASIDVDAEVLASVELTAKSDDNAINEVSASDSEQKNGSAVDALDGGADVRSSDPAELVVPSSDPSHEPAGIAPAHKVEEIADGRKEEKRQENSVEATQDRIQYERVELGSLADFLSRKPGAEIKSEQLELLQRDTPQDFLVAVDIGPAGFSREEGSTEKHIGHQDIGQTSDEVAPCVETLPVVLDEAEDTADSAPSKLMYPIAHLLELRKNSPRDCPETLLTSPVRDDGTATTARAKTSNTKKKSNGKKTSRSATSAPEKTISPLPTLELCNTMRKILQEREDQHTCILSCDNSLTAGSTAALSTVLFGSSRGGACPP